MDEGYNSDQTVKKHYNIETLSNLLQVSGYTIYQVGQFGEERWKNQYLINERIFIVAK
jgi:hypothetical protein